MRTLSRLAALLITFAPACAGSSLDGFEPVSETELALIDLDVVDAAREPESAAEALPDAPFESDTAAHAAAADCDAPASEEEVLAALEAARASSEIGFEVEFWLHFTRHCLPADAPEPNDSKPRSR